MVWIGNWRERKVGCTMEETEVTDQVIPEEEEKTFSDFLRIRKGKGDGSGYLRHTIKINRSARENGSAKSVDGSDGAKLIRGKTDTAVLTRLKRTRLVCQR